MADPMLNRREAMRVISLASAAATFPGFSKWAFACHHSESSSLFPKALLASPGQSSSRPSVYKLLFFASEEYATIECLTEMIIPADETPGARQAGVAEFIDFMVANGSDLHTHPGPWSPVLKGYNSIQEKFRYGISWINAHALGLYGQDFPHCSSEERGSMVDHLAYRDQYRPGEEDGRAFFHLVREYTVAGFYTTRIGLEQLDYPGLKTMWSAIPACPHKDDPEHRHLPAPSG